MRNTQFCTERGTSQIEALNPVRVSKSYKARVSCCLLTGSLWQPNISLSQVALADGKPALAVSFSPDSLCEQYMVIVDGCSSKQNKHSLNKVRINNVIMKYQVSLLQVSVST